MNKKVYQNPINPRERVTACSLEHAKFLKLLGWKEVEATVITKVEVKK